VSGPFVPEAAEILGVCKETYDTTTFTVAFKDAGKKKAFQWAPGQFNMVTLFGIGEAAISISSQKAGDGSFQHTVRAVGDVTQALGRLGPGDSIWLRGPYGKGWPDARGKDLLIIAGGIGLAPLRGVIQGALENRTDYGRFELLYGARTPADLLYTTEFDDWVKRGLTLHLTVDGVPEGAAWDKHVGVVTTIMDQATIKPGGGAVLVCGPEIMMKFVVKELLARKFAPGEIYVSLERRMECGVKVCGRCQFDAKFVCQDGPVFPYSEVQGRVGTIF